MMDEERTSDGYASGSRGLEEPAGQPANGRSIGSRIGRLALRLGALLVVVGGALFAWIWFAPCWLGGCAPLDDLAEYQAEGSQLVDISGEPFATLATVNRRIVSIDSLPPHLPQAFVAVEDKRFYDHSGIDFQRLMGAMISNLRAGGVEEGGSTITQQLARNLFPEWLPYTERSLRRKIMEARVARQIERSFDKTKILELYLNHIYLGNGAYGVEAASRAYFNKSAAEVNLAEAATLAGLPAAPSRLDPTRAPDAARERRNLVLDRMVTAGYVSAAEAADVSEAPLALDPGSAEAGEGPSSSYFVESVRQEMEEIVGSRIYSAGLTIHTTLDLTAQRTAEEQLRRQLNAIESGQFGTFRHPTYAAYDPDNGKLPEYLQGAVVVMDVHTGEVRAMVGGRDFNHSKFNRATQALRQAGSAFKPFVFVEALTLYGSPAEIVEDRPVRIQLAGSRVWEPRNYTGQYEGPMLLRDALVRSKNTVAAQLGQRVGIDRVARTARDLGITSEIPLLPATALGAAEVRPIELVGAYAAFSNGGKRVEPHYIRRIVDRYGHTVWEATPRGNQAIDPARAFILTSMLQDAVNRGTGTAVRAAGFRGAAAGKTGTTNDATDVWFIGYTPDLVAGIWMGLDQQERIVNGATGGTLAAPVWGRIMRSIYSDGSAPAGWPVPPRVASAEVLRSSGQVENPDCPTGEATYTEYFLGRPPAPRRCDTPYYTLQGDTTWTAEEWRTDYLPLDSLYERYEIDEAEWPELAELRRRLREGGDSPSSGDSVSDGGIFGPPNAGQQAPPEGNDSTGVIPLSPDSATGGGGDPEVGGDAGEDEDGTAPGEGPRLLGVPINR